VTQPEPAASGAKAPERDARSARANEALKARLEEARRETRALEALVAEAEAEREAAATAAARWQGEARTAREQARAAEARRSNAELRAADAASRLEDALESRESLQGQVQLLQVLKGRGSGVWTGSEVRVEHAVGCRWSAWCSSLIQTQPSTHAP